MSYLTIFAHFQAAWPSHRLAYERHHVVRPSQQLHLLQLQLLELHLLELHLLELLTS